MADQTTTVLIDVQVQASEALKRQEELKIAIEAQKEALKKLEVEQGKTSQVYIAEEATLKQLNNQLAANGRVLTQMADSNREAAGAYAQLNQRSAEAASKAKDLAAAYGMNDERAKSAAAEAKKLSEQLKEVDSSVGQNQRRVGDYAGELGKLGGGFGGVIGGAQNLGATLTTLKANPFFAILSIVVTLINALSTAMGSGTESGKKLQQAMAPINDLFKGLVKIFSDFLSVLVSGVKTIIDFTANVLSFIPAIDKMNEAGKESIRIEKEKQRLIREGILDKAQDAKEELRIAELKKKINQSDKYTVEQRLAFAREVDKAEKQMALDDANRANNNLKNFLNRMKQQGKAQKDYTEEELKELVDLQTAKYNEQQAYFDKTRKTASREAALMAEIESEKNARIEANKAQADKRQQERDKKEKERLDNAKKSAEEEARIKKEAADKAIAELDYELALFQAKQDEAAAKTNQTNKQIYDDKIALLNEQYLTEGLKLEEQLANEQISQEEYDKQAILLTQQKNAAIAQENAAFEQAERDRKLAAASIDLQNEMAIAEMKNQSLYDLKVADLERNRQLELAEAEKTGADKTLIEQKYAEAKKQIAREEQAAKLSMASNFAGNIAEIFGKQTKIGKLAASAQIAVDSAKGAMAAFTSTASIPVVGPILGAAAAGAVIAKGVKSIKDVWAVKSGLPGDGGGGGASVSTATASASPVANVTGAIVSRNSGQVQQAATSQAVSEAMKANPQQPVLVTNDLTTALNQKVQIKADNSL